ncbi:TRAP transporter small permease [Vibrio natriegens]|uniref:TRAP transporter small permease n=1 Tax=Vibrio natriegens TaxID=691 RepID=UPI0021E7B233|nr:TRAP transporter small permease [Vibrio natriegens]UYI49172.1 TRAP transporter small permease [Vibrio natriegens]
MRGILDNIYRVAGAISGVCIVIICITILVRVTGRWFGVVIPSSGDIAGYLLAASSFLALAYSFRSGSHIRVSLFLQKLSPTALIIVERSILLLASVLVVFLSYQLGYMVWESWLFEEVTHGYIPMPLWAVQLPVAIGSAIFAISVIDTTVRHFLGLEMIPKSEEEQLAEAEPIVLDEESMEKVEEGASR